MKYFEKDFAQWKNSEINKLPNYAILIPKMHKKLKYYWVQKINLKGITYLLHIQYNNESSELIINTLKSIKDES